MKNIQALHGIRNIIVRCTLLAAFLYIAYFFLMKILGLAYHTELRFLNYALYFIAGYYALKSAATLKDNKFSYLQGFGISFIVGSLSFTLFAFFAFIYSYFDSFFTETVLQQIPSAFVMGRFAAPFLITAEGIGMSVIFSLCLMQFFRIYTGRKRKKLINTNKERDIITASEY